MLLAGDVGGTKCRLAIFGADGSLRVERVYPSQEHADFCSLVRSFVAELDLTVEAACFGIPGPVKEGHCKVTKLPWEVDEAELIAATGIPAVRLIV